MGNVEFEFEERVDRWVAQSRDVPLLGHVGSLSDQMTVFSDGI